MRMCSLFFFILTIAAELHAQPVAPIRFKDEIFTDALVSKNLSYRNSLPEDTRKDYFLFDLYQPNEDSKSIERPLIIWMHGGAFMFDSKNAEGVEMWCTSFAKRGYVTAAINYRLTKKNTLFNFKNLLGACAEAVDDAKEAVLYFKANAARFRIDTNNIILAGNSAGAMVALQAAYSTPSALAKISADSTLRFSEKNIGHIAGVINFWGAIFDIDWLKSAHIPIVSVHGRMDNIVPVNQKGSMYGSLRIHRTADTLEIPNKVKIYNSYSHELAKDFNPFFATPGNKKRWQEAGQFAADFLYDIYFRRETVFKR